MELKNEKTQVITLKDKEIDTFKSLVGKIRSESKKIGFINAFSEDERKLLDELNKD